MTATRFLVVALAASSVAAPGGSVGSGPVAEPNAAFDAGETIGVEVGPLAEWLDGGDEPFRLPAPPASKDVPLPRRHPFLFAVEQAEGLPLSEALAAQETQTADRARDDDEAKRGTDASADRTREREAALEALGRLPLRAVLVGGKTRRTLLGGLLLREGDAIPGTPWRVAKISREGVAVTDGVLEVFLPLPPPGTSKAPAAGTQEEGAGP